MSVGQAAKQVRCILFFIFLASPCWANQNLNVRVRTLQNKKSLTISGFGVRIQGQSATDFLRSPAANKPTSALPERIQLTITPAILRTDSLKIVGDLLKVDGEDSSNEIEVVRAEKSDRLDVVAILDIDEYLKGVLPSEMPPLWPIEAFKAQAVASRTYALNEMAARPDARFHLDDSVLHQVFHWQNFAGARLEIRDKVERAIRETRGQVLLDSAGNPYRAYFHSDCGGQTEEPVNVWGVGKKNGVVQDKACAINPKSAWQGEISAQEFEKTIKNWAGVSLDMRVKNVAVASRSTGNRVQNLKVVFAHTPVQLELPEVLLAQVTSKIKTIFEIDGQSFRQLFGFNRVKSTNFNFVWEPQGLKLSGRGHGHGVGMCQKGARYMALAGARHTEILKRYYPKAKLTVPNANLVSAR